MTDRLCEMADKEIHELRREIARLRQQVANLHEDRTLMTTGIARYVDTATALREALEAAITFIELRFKFPEKHDLVKKLKDALAATEAPQ